MGTSGAHVSDSFQFVTCGVCGWEGGTDVTVDLEAPVSMRTEQFVCPNGHENERALA